MNSRVCIHHDDYIGGGTFRTVCAGTFVGGNRNRQPSVCKKFKDRFSVLEDEFFNSDNKITAKAIDLANEWNMICPDGWVRDSNRPRDGDVGRSLLHHAAWAGDLRIFKYLVEAGADVDRRRNTA